MELAKTLVQHLASPFKPSTFHDSYRENVERLIRQKQKGQRISVVAKPKKAPVIDMMEALRRSLAATSTRSTQTKLRQGHGEEIEKVGRLRVVLVKLTDLSRLLLLHYPPAA